MTNALTTRDVQGLTLGELIARGLTPVDITRVQEGDRLDLHGDIVADPEGTSEDFRDRLAIVELVSLGADNVSLYLRDHKEPFVFGLEHILIKVA